MKALTLTQPWASLVALGAKRLETRSWSTPHRGLIAIHAAKGYKLHEMADLMSSWNFRSALLPLLGPMGSEPMEGPRSWEKLPCGSVIAICELTAVRRTDHLSVGELDESRWHEGYKEVVGWSERMFGNYAPGRYAFTLENVRQITPIPARGMLGLWDWQADADADGAPAF